MKPTASPLVGLLIAAAFSGLAAAQSATATKGPVPITGNVPILCAAGNVAAGDANFSVGQLTDASTGFLLPNLSAPPRIITASYCNTRSTIAIAATPMTAQSFTTTPPDGFSNAVNYTATAAGWTTSPVAFATGAPTNPGASQTRDTAFGGDITVTVTNFETAGGNALRLVSDTSYSGTVTVTLVAVN